MPANLTFDALKKAVAAGEIDTVLVAIVDRADRINAGPPLRLLGLSRRRLGARCWVGLAGLRRLNRVLRPRPLGWWRWEARGRA